MKWRLTIIGAVLFFSTGLVAQDTISGVILDSKTKAPLPYTHILLKNTNHGAITNEDGVFTIICSSTDTLIFSFVSYERRELPCSYFIENNACYLTPAINELEIVSVYANLDYLVDIIVKARNRSLRKAPFFSKTYFTLESNSFGKPVELLEVYYNAEINPNGIKNLILKNGKIGMGKLDNHFYVSLSTTNVVSGYNLFSDANNKFPQNPLQLNKGRMKKFYNIDLIGFENGIYQIGLTPKTESNYFFNSVIWVHKTDKRIVKVALSKNNLKKHPLLEIDSRHTIDSLNFYMAYTYSNDLSQSLQKIEIKYDLLYNNKIKLRKIYTSGVFLFYDSENTFDLPYYSLKAAAISDYDKIVFQPYNEQFWKHNEVLLPSKKVIMYRDFFEKNGVLLNYSELSKLNNLFRDKIIPWSEQRVFYNEINYSEQVLEDEASKYYYRSTKTIPFLYDLSYQIYLDMNVFNDSTEFISSTLINLDNSYYFGHLNKYTTAFINIYFDLAEIERRKMMKVLVGMDWGKQQVDSIYKLTHKKLNRKLIDFIKSTYFGENRLEMGFYIGDVKMEIGIDNSPLIIDNQFLNSEDDNSFIDMYSYGSYLFNKGEHKEALDVLMKAYNLGDWHAWLYYNLGLTYMVLSDLNNACYFFMKSKDGGMELDPYVLRRCSELMAPTPKNN